MDFLLVTGLSGAGKSQAIHALEDLGYFCIDNIPPELLERFFEICARTDQKGRFAAVIDVRSQAMFGDLMQAAQRHLGEGNMRLLFLDAADEVLMRRYKETRRRHPLMDEQVGTIGEAVALEREALAGARALADYVVDTSQISAAQLKERIAALFSDRPSDGMTVSVTSFGFKYGLPNDSDLVFDVRCLPNPHYIDELRPLTGIDERVSGYVFGFEQSRALLARLLGLVEYTLPLYVREGKSHLVISMGCTGGKHRSVAFAEAVGRRLRECGVAVSVSHRDSRR